MRSGILVLATSFLFVVQAKASQVGPVELAGNACETPVGTQELLEVSAGRFMVPTGLYVKKEEDKRVARGTCTFALPLQASPGKKIVVSGSHQLVSLRAYPGQTKARVDLEIFKVGSQGDRQSLEVQSEDQIAKLSQVLEKHDVLVETECGGSTLLRGNLSATLMGPAKARAFTRNLFITISEESCQ